MTRRVLEWAAGIRGPGRVWRSGRFRAGRDADALAFLTPGPRSGLEVSRNPRATRLASAAVVEIPLAERVPIAGNEPAAKGERHPILRAFEKTDIMPFGGMLGSLKTDPDALVPLTFIPAFPDYPPETSWMRQPSTDVPGLVVRGRVAFLPADIDRRYARESLPDHGTLLANLIRWAAGGQLPVQVEGPGILDVNVYTQRSRVIAHVVNLTSTGWMPVDELVPVGPIRIRVKLPGDVRGKTAKLLVAHRTAVPATTKNGWVEVKLDSVLDHEVVVIK